MYLRVLCGSGGQMEPLSGCAVSDRTGPRGLYETVIKSGLSESEEAVHRSSILDTKC